MSFNIALYDGACCATACVIEMNEYLSVVFKHASLVVAVMAHGPCAHADYRRDDIFIETRQQRQTTHQTDKKHTGRQRTPQATNNQQQQQQRTTTKPHPKNTTTNTPTNTKATATTGQN